MIARVLKGLISIWGRMTKPKQPKTELKYYKGKKNYVHAHKYIS